MFTNLKNKLIEEVKASPSKFQQLAAQAQAAVSSSTNTTPSSASGSESTATTTTTTNENFFSITEEDTPQNTPLRLPLSGLRRSTQQTVNNGATSTGAVPRTRKLSNSSMASDISFRLPTFDAPATYHLQSDLESEFGSEFGDEATSPGRLEVITKEKLFEAYKKSLDRYNKYRCRYTDLVKQYKELERDSTKARAVLVETQEKALRRINELREQCLLEQGAKAHLEQALRIEMDDMKCKIQAYETKLKLLGESPENIKVKPEDSANDSLIEWDNDDQSKTLNGTATSNEPLSLGESVQNDLKIDNADLEKKLHTHEEKIEELTTKLKELAAENEKLKKQEDENALLLAQTKQAIYTELENKEREVKRLNEELKQAQQEVQSASKKEAQLNGQLGELKEIREKLKQTLSAKQEVDAKLIASEHMYSTLKEQQASKDKVHSESGEKIKNSEQKLLELRLQNGQLNEMLQRYQQNEVSLAEVDNELNRTKNENDNLRASLQEYEEKLKAAVNELKECKNTIEKYSEDDSKKQNELKELMKKLQEELDAEKVQRINNEEQRKKLEFELEQLLKQNDQSKHETNAAIKDVQATHQAELTVLKEQLHSREKDLKTSGSKVAKHKKQHESQQHKIKEQTDELEKLRDELNKHAEHLQALHIEARDREEQTEIEKSQLKSQITSIVQEISQMEEQMRIVQQSHAELEAEKRQLEAHIENMQRDSTAVESKRVLELEKKLEGAEIENSQLVERNCLLEENLNRLEDAHENEMRIRLETAEGTIQKLNEKMAQVLDENSRMQNAQELMDHDQRSLQDKCDALEKEKLMIEDARLCLDAELQQFRAECNESRRNLDELQAQLTTLRKEREENQQERENFVKQIEDLRGNGQEIEQIKNQMQQLEQNNQETINKELKAFELLKEKENEIEKLKEKMKEVNNRMEELERCKEQIALLDSQKINLETELQSSIEELATKQEAFIKLERKLAELEKSNNENEETKENVNRLKVEFEEQTILINEKSTEIEKLREQLSRNTKERTEEHVALKQELTELIELEHRAVEQLEQSKAEQTSRIADLENRLQTANTDVEKLDENNVAYQVEIEQLKTKHQLEVQDLTSTLQRLQDEHGKLQEEMRSVNEKALKLNEFDQLKIENEYLNKHVKQLEFQVQQDNEASITKSQEGDELKEKLKSLQCELYVLKDKAEEHSLQLSTKQSELETSKEATSTLQSQMETLNLELKRQTEHANYVNQQNDGIQKDLLSAQQQLSEMELKLQATNSELERGKESAKFAEEKQEKQLGTLKDECERNRLTIETLNKEVSELTLELEMKKQQETVSQNEHLEVIEPTAIIATSSFTESSIKTVPTNDDDDDNTIQLRELNAALQTELEQLKHNSTMEITDLQHEIEDLKNNAKESSDRIRELECIRAGLQAQKLFSTDIRNGGLLAPETERIVDDSGLLQEKAELETKLKDIMNEVHEVSNRNLFLEQKCENYLILEQSNERLKSQNAKLSRQLDDTLVSMQHNEGMNANTEFEYLRNIMFQYLTGTANGNNETLVKVISAVLKFSPQQTQVALEKEHQRRSLINKIL